MKAAFVREELGETRISGDVLHEESRYRVRTAILEHRGPCLGFSLEETTHVNVWKTRLDELGLPVGPWLRELKQAVVEDRPDDTPIAVRARPSDATLASRWRSRSISSLVKGSKSDATRRFCFSTRMESMPLMVVATGRLIA